MPETMQTSDHDILIELKTEFRTFTTQYSRDMGELKNGTAKVLADHEIRIAKTEKTIEAVQLEKTYQDFLTLKQNTHDNVLRAQTARWVVGTFTAILGGSITWFLITLPSILKTWGIIH